MIIQLNQDQKLRIRFFKEQVEVDLADLIVKPILDPKRIILEVKERVAKVFHTTCIIEEMCVAETEQWTQIGFGVAKQSPRDVYNKRTGKKWALRRAMANAQLNDKNERKKVWDLFIAKFGGYR